VVGFAVGTGCGIDNQAVRRKSVHFAGGRTFVPCHAHRRHPSHEPWPYPPGYWDDVELGELELDALEELRS
jgi:hypothetical protein